MSELSTKPYLVRAIYEWCTDSGLTPYLVAAVSKHCRVPMEFVKNGQIVLNINPAATRNLVIGNDMIQFSARFGGVSRNIEVPMESVVSIYARENAQGLSFPVEEESVEEADRVSPVGEIVDASPDDGQPPTPRGKPQLKIVK